MKFDSKLVHIGRESAHITQSISPPIIRTSTTTFPTLAAYKKSYQGVTFEVPRYGRSGTQTTFELQTAMAELCGTESCIAAPSGLQAIAAVICAYAAPGKSILVQRDTYAKTQALLDEIQAQNACLVEYFNTEQELDERIDEQTSLIFIETPTSLSMKLLDVERICATAQRWEIPVACDSTWGTPAFFDAHSLGINISIHSATKYINGHSDLLLGLITGTYTDLALARRWCDLYGIYAAPDVCWLTLRGLRTLGIRLARHQESALRIASSLQSHTKIERVLFPALASNENHELWKRTFSGAAGPFTIELAPCSEKKFERFINSLKLFALGTSWGGFESLVMPAVPHHLRHLKEQPKAGRLVRLHIGLEDAADLEEDLNQALVHI